MFLGTFALWHHLRLLFDNVTHHEEENLATVLGFLLGLQQVLRVRKKGLVWLGLPCGSFGFICSSLHKRSLDSPLGDTNRRFVQTGNLLSSRGIMLAILGMVRGTYYFVEHPGRTMLAAFPYMRFALALDKMNCRMMCGVTTRWCPACMQICLHVRYAYYNNCSSGYNSLHKVDGCLQALVPKTFHWLHELVRPSARKLNCSASL